MIEFDNVSKRYGTHQAVDGVSLHIRAGELCVLLGPSGCGKTTLLRMVNRLVEPSGGAIRVDGRDVLQADPVALRRGIGYVIQSVGLFPHRTVAQNIATTPELLGMPAERIAARVDELLAMVRLAPDAYRNRYPSQLSGGEAQRVGVARALAADPPIVLMDEPFGAVDPVNRAAIRNEFREVQRALRKTILFVSHDVQEAIALADRIVLMRAGRIEQQGTPADLLARPATPFVESFFGGDRQMLLLGALRAADAADADDPAANDGPKAGDVPADATLASILLTLVARGARSVRVVDAAGAPLGHVSLGSIQRRISEAAAHDSEGVR